MVHLLMWIQKFYCFVTGSIRADFIYLFMAMRRYRNVILLTIALISLVMHYEHFEKDLISIHTWRQTQTQSTIVNFYEEDFNIFNPFIYIPTLLKVYIEVE